jgi:ribosomal protein S18 acetylase RimI-like enzyme
MLDVMKDKGAVNITARTALNNKPSVKLLESLNFRQTGTEVVSFYKDNEGNAITFDGGIYERLLRK